MTSPLAILYEVLQDHVGLLKTFGFSWDLGVSEAFWTPDQPLTQVDGGCYVKHFSAELNVHVATRIADQAADLEVSGCYFT